MSNGLGFNLYAARYMAKVTTAAGTAIGLVNQQVFENLAADIYCLYRAKPIAVWPFYGGNAASHALNLYGDDVITWIGTVTHDANGITSDGTTGYGETAIVPSARLNPAEWSMGLYSRSNLTTNSVDLSSISSGASMEIYPRNVALSSYYYCGGAALINGTPAHSQGLFFMNRFSVGNAWAYHNGAPVNSTATAASTVPNVTLRILAGPSSITTRNLAFVILAPSVVLAEYLTAPATLYTIVQNFQTALARQV